MINKRMTLSDQFDSFEDALEWIDAATDEASDEWFVESLNIYSYAKYRVEIRFTDSDPLEPIEGEVLKQGVLNFGGV